MTEFRLNHLQMEVLKALNHLPLYCGIADEIVAASGVEWRSLTPRFAPLKESGHIKADGTRIAASNRPQDVLHLTQKGHAALREAGHQT